MSDSLPTRDDYFQIGADEVLSRSAVRSPGQRLSREAVYTEGTDINIVIAACSAMADESTRQMAMRLAALFLDSAEGSDLDRLVGDRFSPEVVRKQASPSVVPLTFTRPIPPSSGAALVLNVGTKVRTPQGIEFTLTEVASFALNSTGPVRVAAQAVLSGEQGNVSPGSITQFVSPIPDATLLVTNEEPATGGRNVESDASLRERARLWFLAARRGTLPAIEFGALKVEGVERATAIEDVDSLGNPTGWVSLAIADVNGQSNQILVEAVRRELLAWRAGGVVVHILSSQPLFQEIRFEGIGFKSGIDTRAAIQQLKALTVSVVNLLDPGQPLERALLFSLARSIPGAVVPDTSVAVPGGDVVPTLEQSIKTSFYLVTVNGL